MQLCDYFADNFNREQCKYTYDSVTYRNHNFLVTKTHYSTDAIASLS